MKKVYITPEMEIEKCETMEMLAASLPIDTTETTDDVDDLLGREHNFEEDF